MSLNKGDLDCEVTIQQRATSRGTTGFPVESWTTLATRVWMARRQLRNVERAAAGGLSAASFAVWTMPYREDMDPDVVDVPSSRRLLYRTRVYDIVGASPIGRDGIELETIARVG